MDTIMELIKNYLAENGVEIIGVIVTAFCGFIGVLAKKLYNKIVDEKNGKIVEKVVSYCVQAVEQIYKDLHGEDKLNKVIESATAILNTKGITVTDLELRMLIESAVGSFNDNFNKTNIEEGTLLEKVVEVTKDVIADAIIEVAPISE